MAETRINSQTETLADGASAQIAIPLGRSITLRHVEVGVDDGPGQVVITIQKLGGIAVNLISGWSRTAGPLAPFANVVWEGSLTTSPTFDYTLTVLVRNDSGATVSIVIEWIWEIDVVEAT